MFVYFCYFGESIQIGLLCLCGVCWVMMNFADNAIPIQSWFSDPTDLSLLNLLPMLDALRFCSDVRSVLSRNLHLHRF